MSLIDQIASAFGFAKAQLGDLSFSPFIGRVPPEMKETEQLKQQRGWVYGCVSAIAEEIAAMELRLERRSGEDWKEVPQHELSRLRRGDGRVVRLCARRLLHGRDADIALARRARAEQVLADIAVGGGLADCWRNRGRGDN